MTDAVQAKARFGRWAGLFLSSNAIIAALFMTGAIEPPAPYILFALTYPLLIPIFKAGQQWKEDCGAVSRAMRTYNKRFLTFSAIYMVVMLGAGLTAGELPANSPLLWVLAALPMLPVFGMIWTMARYLREETDEYQRHKAVHASIVGLGFVLVLGTGWGFLETFGLVPHVWSWWVFPVWAMGLGIGMAWPERNAGEAA